jgi:hypothetical protein
MRRTVMFSAFILFCTMSHPSCSMETAINAVVYKDKFATVSECVDFARDLTSRMDPLPGQVVSTYCHKDE